MTARFATPATSYSHVVAVDSPGDAGAQAFTPFPILLHEHGRAAARSRLRRSVVRVTSLLCADVATLTLTWVVIGASLPRLQGTAAIVFGLMLAGAYKRDAWHASRNVLSGVALGSAIVMWPSLWSPHAALTVAAVAITTLAVGVAMRLQRAIVQLAADRVLDFSLRTDRALIVAEAEHARRIIRHIDTREGRPDFSSIGFIDVSGEPAFDALGGIQDLVRIVSQQKVGAMIVSERVEENLFRDIVEASDAAGIEVFALGGAHGMRRFAPRPVVRHSTPLIQLTRPALRAHQMVVKRILDVGLAALLLVCALPIFALIAAAIRLTSRGPAFFAQTRVGLGGRPFRILKFRTMVDNAEQLRGQLRLESIYTDERLFKVRRDPRLTRLGVWLRRTSLDELPQLVNVLRGDMSLVGPRPPLPSEVALYEEHHFTRFDMKPGMTGPWQVAGRNEVLDFDQVIELETDYLRDWTIWKDLEILARTVRVVITMKGAC